MLLEFTTPVDGCDAFDTESAPREDLILICAALTRTVNRLAAEKGKLADALSWFDVKTAGDIPLVEKLGAVVITTGADKEEAVEAFTISLAAALAADDNASLSAIDDSAKKIGRKIGERARAYRMSELGQFFQAQRPQ
jgi:hypothetical protein